MPYRSAILAAIESLKDHETGSPISSIRRHILDDTTSDDASWNEVHFQKSLKMLVEKGDLVKTNGINYKFSNQYLQHRVEALRARAESIEEQTHRNAADHHHSREIPPKEAPAKKTVHAKMKINEGKIITVVNPEVRKRHDEDDMDTTEEVVVEGGGGGRKKHLKIIPRKIY